MSRSLSRAEVRDVDRRAIEEYGLPGIVLMENAGRNAANLLTETIRATGRIAIVCGKGNNGGDGFVMARHLERHGFEVELWLAAAPRDLTGDAAVLFHVVNQSGMPWHDFSHAGVSEWASALNSYDPGWIVDALLGTGLTGPPRGSSESAIHAINQLQRSVFAVDLPSGLDCDTGQPLGPCIRAAHTGTFVARKLGFERPSSASWTGEVHVLDIGIPQQLYQDVINPQIK